MILGQHPQQHPPLVLECGSVSRDHHPVSDWSVARRDRMWLFIDFDQAHATTANRFQSPIVTERRYFDTNTAARFQNRNAWLKLMNFSVNDSFRQFRSFSLL